MAARSQKRKPVLYSVLIVVLAVILLTVNILALGVYDLTLATYLGSITLKDSSAAAKELDATWYTGTAGISSQADAVAHAKWVNQTICDEGIALLKNEAHSIPFTKGTIFSFFSHSSVDWVYATSGSGSIKAATATDGDKPQTLKEAFEANELKVNDKLWNFYQSGNGSSYVRGAGAAFFGREQDFQINECPASVLAAEPGLEDSYKGTVAVFVLSRTCGEGRGLPRSMAEQKNTLEIDRDKSYAEPDSVELGIIEYLQNNADFDEIVLIVNANTAVELGWTANYSKIKTILNIPATGSAGIGAVARVFNGTVTPSGHTVDTFVHNVFSAPAAANVDEGVLVKNGDWSANPTYNHGENFAFGENSLINYYAYQEGIYVGYRYYETRYEDCILGRGGADSPVGSTDGGAWDYAKEVVYPFGFGLSTTTFEWSNFKTAWDGKECTVSVDVTNTGDYEGKDVVQVYIQSPYTDYDRQNGVEKAAVTLAGFAKTGLLKKGQTETVKVMFTEESFKAYDAKGAKTYILDAGTYYITAAKDAHAAINNIILKKDPSKAGALVKSPSETEAGDASFVSAKEYSSLDTKTYAKDTTTGVAITNRFDDCQRVDDPATAADESITFLTRNDWSGTFPVKPYGEVDTHLESVYQNRVNGPDHKTYVYSVAISEKEYARLASTDSLNPEQSAAAKTHTDKLVFGANNGITFSDMRGVALDDERWDLFIDQLTADEMNALLSKNNSYAECPSIGKALTNHSGGPLGFVNARVGYNSEPMTGQTWNVEMAALFGESMGNDMLWNINTSAGSSVVSVGAPGVNIHRSPFGGRSAEYYSEDPVLSAGLAAAEIRAGGSMGIIYKIKHFALNEEENGRGDGGGKNNGTKWGCAEFCNEQAMREVYLRAFELAIKDSGEVDFKYCKRNFAGEMEVVTEQRPALAGIMTAFNRIGYTWAGGCYPLVTNVLREEWGFQGHIVSDMDHGGNMDTTQMLYAGGDSKLCGQIQTAYDGTQFDVAKVDGSLAWYVRNAIKHVLYADVNSFATQELLPGDVSSSLPIHRIIVIAVDVVLGVGIVVCAVLLTRDILKGRKKEER